MKGKARGAPAPGAGSSSSSSAPFLVPQDARLRGLVLKKNGGFLRQWRERLMVVTSDGMLKYQKKKGEFIRVKEVDLVKSDISHAVTLHGSHFCIEISNGANRFQLGFSKQADAKLWQEVMLEAADENAAGRRAWVANLRRVLTLPVRDRLDVVQLMGDRDWVNEWRFCWRALVDSFGEDFNSRRRRLKRLYTVSDKAIWLQFHLFAEVLAEVYFAIVHTREGAVSSFTRGDSQDGADARSRSNKALEEDVDVVEHKSIRVEYGSKSWRGRKRLEKDVKNMARFRETLEFLCAQHNMEKPMASFPMLPLMAAFSMRGVPVVAIATPLGNDSEVIPLEKRSVQDIVSAIRSVNGFSLFPYREWPDLWMLKLDNAFRAVSEFQFDAAKEILQSIVERLSKNEQLLFPVQWKVAILVLGNDRQLFTFGYGECGRLGHGNEETVHEPKVVEYFSSLMESLGTHIAGIAQVSCGREHTMVVLQNGDLYGFGWAEAGRIGTGESGSVLTPSKVMELKSVKAVACGREHTLALNTSGQVFAFGAGFGGRLGHGSEDDAESPVLFDDGKVFVWGSPAAGNGAALNEEDARIKQVAVVGDFQINQVSCGLALALISILGLYGLQRNRYCVTKGKRNYVLGCFILLSLAGASIIIGGGVIGLTLRQVADNAEANNFSQPRVKYFEEAVLTLLEGYVKDDPGGWRGWQNSMYCCGYASVDEMKLYWKNQDDVDTLNHVRIINGVSGTFCAKKASECPENALPCPAKGRTWCRAEVLSLIVDNYSFLGIYAIAIGSCQLLSVCLALFTLMCDVRMLNARSPTLEISHKALSPLRQAARLAATFERSAARGVLDVGPIAWGYGTRDGALAHGDTAFSVTVLKKIAACRRTSVRQISAGDRLSLLLTADGAVLQSGRLFLRQDGVKMWSPQVVCFDETPSIVAVEAGHLAAYAVDDRGRLYSWGTRRYGQLGLGDDDVSEDEDVDMANDAVVDSPLLEEGPRTDEAKAPQEEEEPRSDGLRPRREYVVERVPRPVQLDAQLVGVSAGNHFVVAVCSRGGVYSWGWNAHGQLGLGCCSLERGVGTPQRVDALAETIVLQVAAGHSHALAIAMPRSSREDSTTLSLSLSSEYTIVLAWGRGRRGCLGIGGHADQHLPREVTFFRGLHATQIAAGHDHSLVACAVGAHSYLYAFGGNQFGQLGIGSTSAAGGVDMPTAVDELCSGRTGVSLAAIGAGAYFSAALTVDGELFTWGDARHGKTARPDGRTTFVPWPALREHEAVVPPTSKTAVTPSQGFVTALSVGAHHALALHRKQDQPDRWRKFPLGDVVTALPEDDELNVQQGVHCVCASAHATTAATLGLLFKATAGRH
ncbi:hypothetical protein ATCC90586_003129 [Pythium insidiosum]|nr:hypothetical protein ATCC90586_003129 [Pythium insidiosum]